MPTIRFTKAASYKRVRNEKTEPRSAGDTSWVAVNYTAGTELDVTQDVAERWVRRGVAEIVPAKPKAVEPPRPAVK